MFNKALREQNKKKIHLGGIKSTKFLEVPKKHRQVMNTTDTRTKLT